MIFLIKKSKILLDIYFLCSHTSRFIENLSILANAIKHKELSQIQKKTNQYLFITDYLKKGPGDQVSVSSIGRLSAKQTWQQSGKQG